MFEPVKTYCNALVNDFGKLPKERKLLLESVSEYITKKQISALPVNLVYICTHNSRRSQFGQIWAKVAGKYYNISNVNTFSGGTEATAFHLNAVNALIRAGFKIKPLSADKNPIYQVAFDANEKPINCFSKVYDDAGNPKQNFAAIMTCSDAEENCPFIPGVELRVGTTYNDPKAVDNTVLQDSAYDERCRQIALETFYVFSLIK